MKTAEASNTAKISKMYSVEITRYFLSWEPNFGKSVKEAVKTVSSYDELLKLLKDTKDAYFAATADIRIINRAKLLLVQHLQMTETEAHKYIEKQAMDRCVTKRAVAEQILSTYK